MKLKESYLILIFNLVQKEVYSKEVFEIYKNKISTISISKNALTAAIGKFVFF